ncbi:MAG TPA: class F sortase, partial [Pilimelia sp.]|nr:class F sortase [Pilimelia sp.]
MPARPGYTRTGHGRARPGYAGAVYTRPPGHARPPGRDRRWWTGPTAVLLVLVGLFATGAGLGQATGTLSWPPWGRADEPPPRAFPVLDPSRPIRIRIPSIDVRAPVHAVGLASDGTIAVPALHLHNQAAWYDRGPTPGQFGPAIIVGHADTRTGPSVFHDVPRLRPGAIIEITRRDLRVAIFKVNSVERFAKTRLPAERVYGDYSRPSLRLITCGGRWLGTGI